MRTLASVFLLAAAAAGIVSAQNDPATNPIGCYILSALPADGGMTVRMVPITQNPSACVPIGPVIGTATLFTASGPSTKTPVAIEINPTYVPLSDGLYYVSTRPSPAYEPGGLPPYIADVLLAPTGEIVNSPWVIVGNPPAKDLAAWLMNLPFVSATFSQDMKMNPRLGSSLTTAQTSSSGVTLQFFFVGVGRTLGRFFQIAPPGSSVGFFYYEADIRSLGGTATMFLPPPFSLERAIYVMASDWTTGATAVYPAN